MKTKIKPRLTTKNQSFGEKKEEFGADLAHNETGTPGIQRERRNLGFSPKKQERGRGKTDFRLPKLGGKKKDKTQRVLTESLTGEVGTPKTCWKREIWEFGCEVVMGKIPQSG